MKHYSRHSSSQGGYSIIASILLIGFLLILTTSTLSLVLSEMQDGRGRQDYLKAFYGAEAAGELALFKIKEKGYGYDEDGAFLDSQILGDDNKIPEISYEFESKVSSYSDTLLPGESQIIPLFWIPENAPIESVSTLDFDVSSGDIAWNIIGTNSGESGVGSFDENKVRNTKEIVRNTKEIIDGSVIGTKEFKNANTGYISDFLSANTGSYLIILNPTNMDASFDLNSDESFSLPKAKIISSARVGKYSQNLETSVDNTKFLGILRYSIFSGN